MLVTLIRIRGTYRAPRRGPCDYPLCQPSLDAHCRFQVDGHNAGPGRLALPPRYALLHQHHPFVIAWRGTKLLVSGRIDGTQICDFPGQHVRCPGESRLLWAWLTFCHQRAAKFMPWVRFSDIRLTGKTQDRRRPRELFQRLCRKRRWRAPCHTMWPQSAASCR